jgi:hypothetical protein
VFFVQGRVTQPCRDQIPLLWRQGRLGVSFPKLTLKDPDRVPSTYSQREVGDLVWVDPFPWDKPPIPRPIRYYEGVHYGAGDSNRT